MRVNLHKGWLVSFMRQYDMVVRFERHRYHHVILGVDALHNQLDQLVLLFNILLAIIPIGRTTLTNLLDIQNPQEYSCHIEYYACIRITTSSNC
jgi:hypothetical protein